MRQVERAHSESSPGGTCPECQAQVRGARCPGCGAALGPGGLRALRVLKKSPYGRTYLCEDERGAALAVKEVCLSRVADVAQLEALEREGKVLAQLEHPRIPRYRRLFREGEGADLRLYLVHAYAPGQTLAQHLDGHRFSEADARRLVKELLEVVGYLHGLSPKLLHLDINPQNVIVGDDGSVSLVGFGSARDLKETSSGGRAAPGEASDLCGVGATALFALSRRAPEELLEGSERPRLAGHINVSERFCAFLERLVDPEPKRRFASAAAALAELEADRPVRPRRRWPWVAALAAAALALVGGLTFLKAPSAAPPRGQPVAVLQPSPAASPLERASVNGKYAGLLRTVEAPDDEASYGDFYDWGYWSGTRWAGQTDLPKGHWVYVHPRWYIWRDLNPRAVAPKRSWGPEQATGAPDTPGAGDLATAWASRTPDGQQEWLELDYDEPVEVKAVHVHETFNPGAVVRLTAVGEDGQRVLLWSGVDPTRVRSGRGVSVFPLASPVKTRRITVHLDSPGVAGWNEIDAVGLEDSAGQLHWADGAHASTTYAQ